MKLAIDLPVLGSVKADLQKPMPRAITKPAKAKSKAEQAKLFRRKPLAKSGTEYDRVGEVHHVIPRSLAPERIYDVTNGLLLSKTEHALAETNCPNDPAHRLLDIEGPDDRGQPQTFIWRDIHGVELKRKAG